MIPPLDGIRIIEVGHAIAAPHCAQILADHGAEVIKVEPPTGERGRGAPPYADTESVYFACHNRGKQSICLDLKTDEGLAALLKLCDSADILLTNYSAGVPTRLGWSYAALCERNPTLIYAHITGFGLGTHMEETRAYDGVIQSMSGIPYLTGPADGQPVLAANFPADHIAAYHATMAILMALIGRQATGKGAYLDIPMFDSYFATISTDVDDVKRGRARTRTGNKVLTGFQDTFKTADGEVFIAPLGFGAWERFCSAMGKEEWRENVSYEEALGERRDELQAEITKWTVTRSTTEILAVMLAAEIACGPVKTISEAVDTVVDMGRGMVTTVTTGNGTKVSVPGPPIQYGLAEGPRSRVIPDLGVDTDAVLASLNEPLRGQLNGSRSGS
jgi:crotonobetainyl-CoA:carnitine CoA-transferase CaiB-like acyl-CoA transferase